MRAKSRTARRWSSLIRPCDGEQSPGATLNIQEKLEIAHQLARLGVDIMEAGFPAASPGDLEAVRKVANTVGRRAAAAKTARSGPPAIAGLAHANKNDIDKAWEAVRRALRRASIPSWLPATFTCSTSCA